MILNLTNEEVNMLDEILEACAAFYEATGDDDNPILEACYVFQDKLDVQKESECSNEIWW